MTNIALNRIMQAVKTNKSGGSHAQGDVCVEGASTANSVVNNTAGAYKDGAIWVCLEPNGVADNASGLYAQAGYVPKINLSGSASLVDLIKTHTVAKQGVRHAAPFVAGDFAMVLGTGSSPAAWLFGMPYQGGTTGAPTDAEYVTTAANGTLSAEANIPGLAGHPDRNAIGGAGTSEEYDTSTTGLSWDNTPTTVDSDTTIPSHLYIRAATINQACIGTKSWSPAGAFDARCKITFGLEDVTTGTHQIGIHIGDSGNSNRVTVNFEYTTGSPVSCSVKAYTYASATYTQRGQTFSVPFGAPFYLRITRDGSNNVSFWFSLNGLVWMLIATQSFTFTVANIGFRTSVPNNSGAVVTTAVDWLRTDV